MWVIRPNLAMSYSPSVLINPGSTTMSWTATGADRCSNRYIGTNAEASGSKTIPVMSTTTETIICYFGSQSISKSRRITVKYGGRGGDF